MSPLNRIARLLLILHSLVSIALGAYSFINVHEYAAMTGMQIERVSHEALQSIGLGAIAVGWYQLLFCIQGNRRLMAATIPLRCGFAAVMCVWERPPLVIYELVVVWFCLIAVFA